MKLVKEGTLSKVQASENMYLATKDLTEVFGNYLYLGIYDSIENYVEITETKRNEILAEQEKKYQEEMDKLNQQ